MRSRIGQTMQLYLREHVSLFIFTIVLFIMGVIFGAMVVNSLTLSQKQDLFQYLSQFFRQIETNRVADPGLTFQQALGHYLKYIGFMWILGLSIIGLPLILIMLFLKGLVVGFTVGFLVSQLRWEGLSFAFVSVVPQNLLVIPAMIIVGVAGISFSLRLIKSRFLQRGGRIFHHFLSYSVLVLLMALVLTFASAFEAFVSPVLMKAVTTSNL
ncbi:stage II sporulation protein M [Bacillaceae bacterium]